MIIIVNAFKIYRFLYYFKPWFSTLKRNTAFCDCLRMQTNLMKWSGRKIIKMLKFGRSENGY